MSFFVNIIVNYSVFFESPKKRGLLLCSVVAWSVAFFFIFFAQSASAAITHLNTVTHSALIPDPAAQQPPETFSVDAGTGSGRALIVRLGIQRSYGMDIGSVTYNGESLTRVIDVRDGGRSLQWWEIANPSEGVNEISISFLLNSISDSQIHVAASVYSGVDTSVVSENYFIEPSEFTSSKTANATSTPGNLVLDMFIIQKVTSLTPGEGQTATHNTLQSSEGGNMSFRTSHKDGDTTTAMSWTAGIADNIRHAGGSLVGDLEDPTSPTDFSATAVSISQINLSWTASTDNVGVSHYKIFRSGTLIATTTMTSYSNIGLSPATTYSYTVSAVDVSGNESGQTASVSATTETSSDTEAPSQPTGLSGTAQSSSQIDLSWTASTDNVGIAGYKIYRCSGTGCTPTTQTATTTGTSTVYSSTNLSDNTTYTFAVAAYDDAGNTSDKSSNVSETTLAPPPPPPGTDTQAPSTPTNLTVSAKSSSQIDLSWTASTDDFGIGGYKIYRCTGTDCTPTTQTATTTGTGTSFTSINLQGSTVYVFAVAAYDTSGNTSAKSASASTTTFAVDTEAPSTPTNLTATAISSSRIDLTWNSSTDNVGVSGYRVFRGDIQIATTTPLAYSDTGLSAETVYIYTVSAFDAALNISIRSQPASTTTLSPDTTPPTISSIATSSLTQNSFTITWNTNEPADSLVEYGLTTLYGNASSSLTLKTSHSITLSGLSAGTSYNYKIRSKDAAGNEVVGTNRTFKTLSGNDTTLPGAITDLIISDVTQTSLTLFWTAPGDDDKTGQASSYDIRFSLSPITEVDWNFATPVSGEPIPLTAGSKESYTLTGLQPGVIYYFGVKTIDEVGNISLLSNVPQATTLSLASAPTGGGGFFEDTTPPSKPSNIEVISADSQIAIKWKNPTEFDFVRTILIRKTISPPTSINEGKIIYEGTREEYTDIFLDNNQTYYYGLISYDLKPNYSEVAQVEARPIAGVSETQVVVKEVIETPTVEFFKDLLGLDSTGEAVTLLQQFLAQDPEVYPEGIISGEYGALTQLAVQRFQCKYKVVCGGSARTTGYGIIDEKTLKKLNEIYVESSFKPGDVVIPTPEVSAPESDTKLFSRNLGRGLSGDDIFLLQEKLQELGFFSLEQPPTGYFGPITEEAVKAFQRSYGIVSEGTPLTTGYGNFGPITRAKLIEVLEGKIEPVAPPSPPEVPSTVTPPVSPPPAPQPSPKEAEIEALQEELRLLENLLKILKEE